VEAIKMEENYKSIKVTESVYNRILRDRDNLKHKFKKKGFRWSISNAIKEWIKAYDEREAKDEIL
jgi:hypothetical protein